MWRVKCDLLIWLKRNFPDTKITMITCSDLCEPVHMLSGQIKRKNSLKQRKPTPL